MDWWHVALDIRPSSAETSSTGTKSSSSKPSSPDIFSIELATSKARASAASKTGSAAAEQTRSPKTASSVGRSSSAAAKHSSTAKSASSGSKPGSAANADDSSIQANSAASTGKSGAVGKSSAGKSAKTSSSANSSEGGGAEGSSRAGAAAAGTSVASGLSKGRASARSAAAKANGAADPQTQGNAITDPSADASNASGLSLLQLLAQSLEGNDSAAPSTDTSTTASKPNGGSDTASNDANTLALAMFAQAFAAALGTTPAAARGATSDASALSGATEGITDATRSSGGSVQELVSLLAQDITAGGKSAAARSDVATTVRSPGDTSAAGGVDTATSGANSLAASVAHLGAVSHFSQQHTQTSTNTGELKSSVGSTAWTDELGGQLTWMTHRGLESGSLRVSPEHLGPVEVQISVQNGDASVWFGASHPDTRAALEQALPRLREMFANQGLTLTDSGVSRESPRQTRSSAPQSVAAVSAIGSADVSVSAAVRLSLGLVDTYA
jgi:flagellar hook-length control protein FliK